MSWLDNPVLQKMDKEKLELIKEFSKETNSKSLTQSLPFLMTMNKKLQSKNLSFTKEETQLILEALTKDLSPKEQAQVEALKKFMST